MKTNPFLKTVGLMLAALFFSLLEIVYQALRFLIKWLLVAIVFLVAAIIFIFMLPYSLYKSLGRAIRQRSFTAGCQLFKWICIDYFKHLKL